MTRRRLQVREAVTLSLSIQEAAATASAHAANLQLAASAKMKAAASAEARVRLLEGPGSPNKGTVALLKEAQALRDAATAVEAEATAAEINKGHLEKVRPMLHPST